MTPAIWSPYGWALLSALLGIWCLVYAAVQCRYTSEPMPKGSLLAFYLLRGSR